MTESAKTLWIDKFSPKTASDFIGNKKSIWMINDWLSNFEKNKADVLKKTKNKKKKIKIKIEEPDIVETIAASDNDEKDDTSELYLLFGSKTKNVNKSCLVVTGQHGVGKTTAVNVCLKELKYDVQVINFANIKSSKNAKDIIEKLLNSSNILNMMKGKKRNRIAIVIDELESITSSTEKNFVLTLLKTNEEYWFCPIIFISNNQHNKLLSDIKKGSIEIRFWPPMMNDMLRIFTNITEKEDINIANKQVVNTIIDHSQNDIRRLIFTLQDIKYAYSDEVITIDIITEYCNLSKKKDVDFDLFMATNGLLYEYKTIDDCLRYYETEKVLLPLMIHQNYISSLLENDENEETHFDTITNISELLSKGDVVENYIYGDQNWDMQEIHGYYTCVATSYALHNSLNEIPEKVNLAFTSDLNKTSIKKINRKNILNANKCFKNMDIHDYININKIIRKLISESNIGDCTKLMKDYNIKLEHIESLLKIDKIKNSKTSLTSRQKNEFSDLLSGNPLEKRLTSGSGGKRSVIQRK
jgi:DNA polymerase III delta prime subunit